MDNLLKLIPQLLNIAVPIVADIIRKKQAATGAMPTDAEITAELHANVDRFLAQGASWRASHPDA